VRNDGYLRLWRGLSDAVDIRGVHRWDQRRPPYPGLLAFDESDAAVFFGRDDAVRALKETLLAIRRDPAADERFVLVLGASGSGRSSLVRAGVVPLLKYGYNQDSWLVLAPFRPGVRPLNELAKTYARAFADTGENREWSPIRDPFVKPWRVRTVPRCTTSPRISACERGGRTQPC
jgi:hypothetical protein